LRGILQNLQNVVALENKDELIRFEVKRSKVNVVTWPNMVRQG